MSPRSPAAYAWNVGADELRRRLQLGRRSARGFRVDTRQRARQNGDNRPRRAAGREDTLMLTMEIDSIRVSLMNYQRVVILKQKDTERYLPIWIGSFEADAIAMKLQDAQAPRPLTHDLLGSVIEGLQASVQHVVVFDLSNGTFYCQAGDRQGRRDAPRGRLPPLRCHRRRRAHQGAHLRRGRRAGEGRHPHRPGRRARRSARRARGGGAQGGQRRRGAAPLRLLRLPQGPARPRGAGQAASRPRPDPAPHGVGEPGRERAHRARRVGAARGL